MFRLLPGSRLSDIKLKYTVLQTSELEAQKVVGGNIIFCVKKVEFTLYF